MESLGITEMSGKKGEGTNSSVIEESNFKWNETLKRGMEETQELYVQYIEQKRKQEEEHNNIKKENGY